MSSRENVHATGIVLGDHGVLLRGPSGAGKSLLALELLRDWARDGRTAVLVGDDRLDLEAAAGRVTMHVVASIAGLIELRGRGIVSRPFRRSAVVSLVVDLVDALERMPEPEAFTVSLLGVAVPRCPVARAGAIGVHHQLLLVREALRLVAETPTATVQNIT